MAIAREKVSDLDNDEELHEAQETLRFYLEKLYRDVSILAERLELPLFAAEVARKFRLYRNAGLLDMEHELWDIGSQSLDSHKSDHITDRLPQ